MIFLNYNIINISKHLLKIGLNLCKFRNKMNYDNLKPVIVILGATGTGKSKLGLEIASKFNGEIISADSMQSYKGLPITTNKVTAEELALVKHHMIDILDPKEAFSVVHFRDQALPIIDKLHKEEKLPIIVGGTHYYAESVLWNVLIQTNKGFESRYIKPKLKHVDERQDQLDNLTNNDVNNSDKSSAVSSIVAKERSSILELMNFYDTLSNVELLEKLSEIDPEIASRYHPNERRKVIRSLEVWHQTGILHSTHVKKQQEEVGNNDLGGNVRYPNAVVLWITCEQTCLDKRLDARVDTMVEQGLVEELNDFYKEYSSFLKETAFTKGILQNIGLKEFHSYLSLSEEEKNNSPLGKSLYNQAIENMKMRTRQYSRRQLKWMRNRFLARQRLKVPVYALDGSDLKNWEDNVGIPATDIVRSIINGKEPSQAKVQTTSVERKKTKHVCETCDRIILGEIEWENHLKGAKHRLMLKRKEM